MLALRGFLGRCRSFRFVRLLISYLLWPLHLFARLSVLVTVRLGYTASCVEFRTSKFTNDRGELLFERSAQPHAGDEIENLSPRSVPTLVRN